MDKKLRWCHAQLSKELDWQVFQEGSSYEGSTRYHVLVTELFIHGFLITGNFNNHEKLRRMLLFIERCKPNSFPVRPELVEGSPCLPGVALREAWEPVEGSSPISIGDDDSGIVMHPSLASLGDLAQQLGVSCDWGEQDLLGLHSYSEFGLSIYRSDQWHISLRQAA